MTNDIYVYIVDLPVDEMVAPCPEGYTIYLNARLSYRGRVRAYLHALDHIESNDWEKVNVQQIEKEAHNDKDSNLSPGLYRSAGPGGRLDPRPESGIT